MIKTYRYRIKDKNTAKYLNKHAEAVNFVWNYCNNIQKQTISRGDRWPSTYDLQKLTKGAQEDLGLSARTVQDICDQYVKSRIQHRKRTLRYRTVRRNLGWVPFKVLGVQIRPNGFVYRKHLYRVWKSREIPENAKILCGGSFSQDSKRNWYINIKVELPDPAPSQSTEEVGIDLGLTNFLTCSDGLKIEAPQFYRKAQEKLAKARRSVISCKYTKQIRNIHNKIKNQRKDFHSKAALALTRRNGLIIIGKIDAQAMMKTVFSKSVCDAGWFAFKQLLRYKAIEHGVRYLEVNESCTTVTCSSCFSRSGPKGIAGLQIREWECSNCNTVHDRDINAAKNILRLGHQTLVEGVPV